MFFLAHDEARAPKCATSVASTEDLGAGVVLKVLENCEANNVRARSGRKVDGSASRLRVMDGEGVIVRTTTGPRTLDAQYVNVDRLVARFK